MFRIRTNKNVYIDEDVMFLTYHPILSLWLFSGVKVQKNLK